ncbi:hypothetical protein [Actinacidiphila soli]|uniref:hypothetical protein n=1 Tax=Actinacidiphila soli TaxID=2487275 RepID=UPI000FC9CE8C|nr:hypothetical protein [Actinacidiphila soli]
MTAATAQPTSAQLRRVRWRTIDRALEGLSTDSLLVLLRAALDSPGCARFHDHLLLAWTRVLRTPRRPGRAAGADDLPALVQALLDAAPGRGVLTERAPNDPRAGVRFEHRGHRWLVHPGELDHPLVFLRSLQGVARAVDERLVHKAGFTLSDLIELALRHTDHTVSRLGSVWPADPEDHEEGEVFRAVTGAEVAAADALGLDHLAPAGPDAGRSAKALAYLSADIRSLPLRYAPHAPLLGPVLAVTAHGRSVPVPASAVLDSLAAAVDTLLAEVSGEPGVEETLRQDTAGRVAQLLGIPDLPQNLEQVSRIRSTSHRLEIAVVASLADRVLPGLIERARADLARTAPHGAGRLVVYGGPRTLSREVITDTLYLHVEELAEILADAGGDLTTVACWVLEMTQHPGAEAVAYYDVFDAWTAWHGAGTLLPPGGPGDVVLTPPYGSDLSWDRAAAWAGVDDVLAAAGLPTSLVWRIARLTAPDTGTEAGAWADLSHPGDGASGGAGPMIVCVSTSPPLAVLVTPAMASEGAMLDTAALATLADAVRATLSGHWLLTEHFTLPDGAAWLLHLTETAQPRRPLPTADGRTPPEALALHVGMDPEQAKISIELDPPFLARFADDGHQILGTLLHHCAAHIRTARGAGDLVTADAFTDAWDAAGPVLTWHAAADAQPPPAPPYTVPRSVHVHARALRTATAAVRRARVPAGVFAGPEALRRGGPAEQLLHALERELREQICAHHPSLTVELTRHLNAALAVRARGRQEAAVNLAAPWAANWVEEAVHRESDGAAATTALQLLVQQAIATPPTGERPADVLAVAELLALAELVLRSGLTAVASSKRLHDLHLEVHDSGLFLVTDTSAPSQAAPGPSGAGTHTGFDQDAYRRAQEEHWIGRARDTVRKRLGPEELFALHHRGRTPIPFATLDPAPGSHLAHADQVLHEQWGCGLDALAAVLGTAADWPAGLDGTATTTETELVVQAVDWSRLPEQDLCAAVGRLLLHPGNAADGRDHPYTEVERRTRLTTHPLIGHGGQVLILPWLVHTAQLLYSAYLAEGRMPRPDVPEKAVQHLDNHRQQHNDQLERDLKAIAESAGLPHCPGLEPQPAAQLGIPGLTGEIDLLVADEQQGRLWVIEAKNPHGAIAPHNVAQHLDRFGDHRARLLAKVAVIAAYPGPAARACGVRTDRAWHVVPLLVTRTIEPAAFTADPRVPFTIADYLAGVLTASALPRPGWNAPARTGR